MCLKMWIVAVWISVCVHLEGIVSMLFFYELKLSSKWDLCWCYG